MPEPRLKLSLPVAAGWSARIIAAACALLNTRLLIELLGVDDYAAITIVLSLLPWFGLLNLGLPNAAQNAIARARAGSEDVDRLRKAAVGAALLGGVALLPVGFGLAAAVQHTMLRPHPGLSYAAVSAICAGLLLNAFSAVFHQVMYALHRAVWPALAPAVQSLLSSAALALCLALGVRGTLAAALALALPMVAVFALSGTRCGARKLVCIDTAALRELLHEGRGFLLFGFAAQATLACDYVVMAWLLPSQDIVQYNLASRSFGVILTLHAVLLAAAWTPMSDHYFRGEKRQLRRDVARLLATGYGLAALLAIPLVLGMDYVVMLLSGAQTPPLPAALVGAWCVYLLLRVWCDTFATTLLSAGELATINRYVVWQALVSVPAQWWLASWWGPAGIVAGVVVSFVVTAAWVLPLRFFRLTRE